MAIRLREKSLTVKYRSSSEVIDFEPWMPTRARVQYDAAINKLSPSPKAKKILAAAESASQVVEVLVTTNYFSKYFSPSELRKRYGTVLDDNASLIIWDPGTTQPVKTVSGNKPEFLKYMEDSKISTKKMMDPFMILIHEFGHFMQFLHLPEVYEIQRERSYEEAEKSGTRTIDDAIEDENVQHHESPVAYELGQPIRYKYWDQ